MCFEFKNGKRKTCLCKAIAQYEIMKRNAFATEAKQAAEGAYREFP